MTDVNTFAVLDHSLEIIIDKVLPFERRVLFFGEPGIGKSTLTRELARALWNKGRRCRCIGADPGSPSFGPPGALCRGEWRGEGWELIDMEALCSLDAARFRLPLVSAVRRLRERESGDSLLFVDAPGVVRGVAGAELLPGLVDAAAIDVILVLTREGREPPLPDELKASGCEVFVVKALPAVRHPGKQERTRARTQRWDAYLAGAAERRIELVNVKLIGTPPPRDVASAWTGRQISLIRRGRTVALGEILAKERDCLRIRMPRGQTKGGLLLVRDAKRGEDGFLNTAKPFSSDVLQYLPPPDVRPYSTAGSVGGPCPVVRIGLATATLVNGIFGDPLLHLRLRHQKRSLLFDLGEGGRLPGRVAHRITDVFISHAHFDHIGGFLWLLRSRIGDFPVCRIFGPPGIAGHIESLVHGIHWDRVGENGPRFEVAELHGERLVRFAIQAGYPDKKPIGEAAITQGIILEESTFRVRATTLDHGIPVLAFAFEQPRQLNIRKDRLAARGLPVGPWLGELKRRVAEQDDQAPIRLPDGNVERTGELADDLVLITPGKNLAYATDLADTADNRQRLTALAKGAHTFFCEATFARKDIEQAIRTGHLTARACGEIATAADVEHLVPFHFSRRYQTEPERIYDEVRAVCSRVVMPR